MNYYNYFTEIEEHFVRRRGKHLFVSPMDWSLITTWRDSGVPLHVAIRGIDIAMDGFYARPTRHGRINSLFYCHDAVMEEFSRFRESHVGEAPGDSAPQESGSEQKTGPAPREEFDRTRVLKFFAHRLSEIKALSGKLLKKEEGPSPEGLERIRIRLEELQRSLGEERRFDPESLERDLGILEQTLVSELHRFVLEDEVRAWEQEAKKELKVYKKRLPGETYQKILQNYLNGKIHRKFDLGELSLFHL